jgi:hypothetical protein
VQPQPAIELSETLTVSEMRRYLYFHTLSRDLVGTVVVALMLLVGVPLLVGAAISDPDWRSVLPNAAPLIVLFTFLIGFTTVMPYRRAQKLFNLHRALREPVTYVFTPETLSANGATVSWTMKWEALTAVQETKNLFLLYTSPKSAAILPKRFFPHPAELNRWRQLVMQCIAPKRIKPPGFIGGWC